MTDKQQSIIIMILVVSVINFIDKPSQKVSKVSKQIKAGLRKRFLKSQKNSYIKVPDPEYTELNKVVTDAWDKTRHELVSEASALDSSLAEMLQHLYDRLNRNEYQNMFVTEKNVVACINSIRDCPFNETISLGYLVQTTNNSRLLCDRFLELCKIPKQHNLATRRKIIEQNLLIEKGYN
jgi:hypothetical protein